MTKDNNTIKEFMLDAGQGHALYVQDWGNVQSQTPIVYLHGGPGSGVADSEKSLFDPNINRVIFFDQRGCGKSTPYGSLESNTTEHLVNDISLITDKLGIDSFVIVGGSWGVCLGLAYAIKNSKRVKAMILRGVFTGTQNEIDFIEKGKFRFFFPDVWSEFNRRKGQLESDSEMKINDSIIYGENRELSKKYMYICDYLEGSLASLDDRYVQKDFESFDPIPTTIERHYIGNQCFLKKDYIVQNTNKLEMPIFIVQGRYDSVCAPVNAYNLDAILPNSTLTFTQAGHSKNDRANWEATKLIIKRYFL